LVRRFPLGRPRSPLATPIRSHRAPRPQSPAASLCLLNPRAPISQQRPKSSCSPVAAALALPLPHGRLNRVRGSGTPPSSSRIAAATGRDRHRHRLGALPPRCQLSFGPLPSLSPNYKAKGRKGGESSFRRRFRRSSLSPVAGTAPEMEVDRGIGVWL
jgi:hypothetical protein